MKGERVTAATLEALARIHGRLYQDLEASFADEPERPDPEWDAWVEWADAHPMAQTDLRDAS